MYVWNVSSYEPLPLNKEHIRPMRSGLICTEIVRKGHEVELWLPGFEHVHHYHIKTKSAFDSSIGPYGIQFLHGCGYDEDISIKRILHNNEIAKEFLKIADERKRIPDVILTQIPTLELSQSVVKFANKHNIPIVVDIRDPWPDVYKRILPAPLSWLGKIVFCSEYIRLKRILKNATCITAVSEKYLDWAIGYRGTESSCLDKVFHIGYHDSFSEKEIINDEGFIYENNIPMNNMIVTFAGTFGLNIDYSIILKLQKILELNNVNDVHIVVAGKGKGEHDIEKRARESSNLTYLGWLNQEKLLQVLNFTSVGLIPSRKSAMNSLPNKPFEYMAASLPIISSLTGELKKLIEQESIGIYYKAEDENQLYKAIMFLRHETGRRALMSLNSRKLYENYFSTQMIYPNFIKHLEMVSLNDGTKYAEA